MKQGLSGLALAEALQRERLAAITEARKDFGETRTGPNLTPRPLSFARRGDKVL